MKVLFLLSEGFDTPGPSNHLIQTLIEDVLECGIDIHMIESRRKRINEDIPDNLKEKKGLTYDVINRPFVKKSNFIKRYIEEIIYSFKCVKYWINKKDIDVVFIQSCPTVVFPIILIKILMRKPIIYSIQDMFPGSAISSGVIKNKVIGNIFKIIQRIAYKLSNKVTVISEDMKQKVLEQGVLSEKISVIVNWYDDSTVNEVLRENNRFIKKYNLKQDKFYVQYAGTMGYVFNYKAILEVAYLLREEKNIVFQMIGEGSQREEFIKSVKKMELDNIIFYPLEPQYMVSDVYSACSVCLIPLKKGIIGNSVPSKAALLMACRRPIINLVDKESQYYAMFNKNNIGISISNDKEMIEELKETILYLTKNPEKSVEMANNAKKFGEKYYARSSNTRKFIKLFKELKQ